MDAIPFEYASPQAPLIVLEARIGEARDKIAVVLDTGGLAPFDVILGQAVAQRMGLALSDEVTPETTTAVGPRKQSYRTASLSRFTLGPVTLAPATAAVTPMVDQMGGQVGRKVDAIVGQYFLRSRTIAIDYAARKLDLTAEPGAAAQAVAFSLGRLKPLMLVTATVNGVGPFTLELDTGATGTTLSPEAAARAGVASRGQGVLGGAGGAVSVGYGEASVTFDGVTRKLPRVALSDAMGPISAAAGAPIDGILGTDFFDGTRLTIDYPAQRLWLTPTR
jgi:predicted aspartyl protease